MEHHDAVIVGAGPAGLAAARECSNAGIDTLLVEKDDILQPKKSIEAFTSTIESFGLQECVVRWIKKDRYVSPALKDPIDIVSEEPKRAVIDQQKFTELMIKGINCSDKTKVVSAQRDNGKVILKTQNDEEIEAKIVIDATGHSASIARMLGEKIKLVSSHLSAGWQVKGNVGDFGIDADTCLHFNFAADTKFGKRPAEL